MKVLKTIGKVTLVLLGCVLMPVLIWVALGAAVYQKFRARKAQTAPAPTFGQIIAAAGFRRK
ncbi:MAG: hypothetical protein Q8O16_03055 [Dehalococcoidia bacterium]|nr:hypothetical protein [Dehalococcoidia bacterium]